MGNEENFMRVLEYQRLKYSLEKQGIIKPDNTHVIYTVFAFIAGVLVGSILPW